MAKYSPIGPVELLLEIKAVELLPDYLLLLAHEVFEKSHLYADLLQDFRGTIILDNSLIELGKPVSPGIMLSAAQIVKPNFVVLPDKLDDREATVKLSKEAINTWFKDLPKGTGAMVAAQGINPEDALWCVDSIASILDDSTPFLVGVPRNVANVQGSREPLTRLLTESDYQVHLLGMSENLADDILCSHIDGVLGIDSASPLRAGWEGLTFNGVTTHLKNRELFFKECLEINSSIHYNISEIATAVKG